MQTTWKLLASFEIRRLSRFEVSRFFEASVASDFDQLVITRRNVSLIANGAVCRGVEEPSVWCISEESR